MSYIETSDDRAETLKQIELIGERIRSIATNRKASNEEKEAVIDCCLKEMMTLQDNLNLM